MEKRTHSVSRILRLTPEEAACLDQKAKEADLSVSSYIRFMITQKPNDHSEIRQSIRELRGEITSIGNSIHQLIAVNKEGCLCEADKTQLIAYLRKINIKLDEAVKRIGNQ